MFGYSSIDAANLGWGHIFAVFPPLYAAILLIVFGIYQVLKRFSGSFSSFGFYACSSLYWLSAFIILLVVWGLTLLMFWPGSFTSDTTDCIAQALGIRQLSSHHSVFFTVLMMPVVRIANACGNLESGLAVLSSCTLIFVAGICSYTAYWVMQRTKSKTAFVAVLVFFVLNPVIAQYSISVLKDTFFAGILLLFCLKMFDLVLTVDSGEKVQPRLIVALGIIGLLCMLLRHNGLIIFLLTTIVAFVLLKNTRKALAAMTVTVLVLFSIVTGPVYDALNVKRASFAETVGIPIQQLARSVVDGGTFPEGTKQYINELMNTKNIEKVFDPRLVDPVKWDEGFDDGLLNEDKLKFLGAWLESLPSNFKSYLIAWRDLTLGYWYVASNASLVAAPGYAAQNILDGIDGVNWPEVTHPDGVNLLGTDAITAPETVRVQIDLLRGVPVIGLVYNIGFMVWGLVGVCCWLYCRQESRNILALLPLLALWLTMLVAAPAFSQLRYMIAFEFALPLLVLMLCFNYPRTNQSKSRARS